MVSISYLLLSLIYPINYMLRGMTRVRIVLYSAAVSVVINVLSNYILIFGHFGAPKLGVIGAALGTVATRAGELAILLIYLVRSKNPILTEFHKMFSYSWKGFKSFLSKALPLAGNEFFWGMGTTLYFVVYGHMGKEALAAMSIMATIQTLIQTFGLSFSGSAAVIVGNEIGKGNREAIYLCGKRFHRLAICVGVILTTVMLLLTKQIVRIYGISGTETGVYLTQCLYIMSSFLILNTYNS